MARNGQNPLAPTPDLFIVATALDRDSHFQEKILKTQRVSSCRIEVLFWDDFEQILLNHEKLMLLYYPQYFSGLRSTDSNADKTGPDHNDNNYLGEASGKEPEKFVFEYVKFEGNKAELKSFLEHFFIDRDVAFAERNMSMLIESLDRSEKITITKQSSSPEGAFGFMFNHDTYYLNIRNTSLALFGLLLDIKFTNGFATFALNLLGVKADKIRKLNMEEKEFLVLVNAEKVVQVLGRDYYEILGDSKNDYTGEEIERLVNKLKAEDIIHDVNGVLKICF